MAYQGDQQSSRQRMRPWLESRINSGEIPGLEWVDQTQLIFKVPWKHVGNREWREDDSQIFKVEFCIVLKFVLLAINFLISLICQVDEKRC